MRRKKIIEASVVCILLLLLGAYMEFSSRSMDDKNRETGSGTYAECGRTIERL